MMLRGAQWKIVRYTEIAVVAVLLVFAILTYHELNSLRQSPVVLPKYEFEITGGADPSGVVVTRGTWIGEKGIPEPLQTTSIECRYATMHCVESTAAVTVMDGKGLLEANSAQFDVDHWNAQEIVAKPQHDRCRTRSLVVEISEKRAKSHVAPLPDVPNCRVERERDLELVAGYQVRR